MINKLHIWLW